MQQHCSRKEKSNKRTRLGAALAGSKRGRRVRVPQPLRQRRRTTTTRRRKTSSKRGIKLVVKHKLMSIWQNMVFPVRRVWLTLSSRLKSSKNGAGLLKLQDDVQTCEYSDVQVMWEILQRTESEVIDKCHKRKQLPFWRIFVWSNHHEASSQSAIKQT
ncbi:uncharacterized protein LOC130748155 [Lotus japonicus]|uniref:uncharacterized protein LOC130748155 n=1 Tax=Lotus japonicus TaxID=34305 RepID=UPI002583F342|nr:uncharacterized protein LOC130748155 [Lotus japonicus]